MHSSDSIIFSTFRRKNGLLAAFCHVCTEKTLVRVGQYQSFFLVNFQSRRLSHMTPCVGQQGGGSGIKCENFNALTKLMSN